MYKQDVFFFGDGDELLRKWLGACLTIRYWRDTLRLRYNSEIHAPNDTSCSSMCSDIYAYG
jgi:hypothetical protein